MIAAGCTIDCVIEQRTSRDVRGWRPQEFGKSNTRDIPDPLIEPLWIGQRVLVHMDGADLEIFDAAGEPVTEGIDAIARELRAALRARSLVLDGYLTHQATAEPPAVPIGQIAPLSAGEMATQMLIGRRSGRNGLAEEARAAAAAEASDSPLAFVAIDLLLIDGTPLLSVPLLERKRLLESAVEVTELVRLGAYVRPPVDSWLGTWRALGFISIAFKAANSRYEPGARNDGWAIARIPSR